MSCRSRPAQAARYEQNEIRQGVKLAAKMLKEIHAQESILQVERGQKLPVDFQLRVRIGINADGIGNISCLFVNYYDI